MRWLKHALLLALLAAVPVHAAFNNTENANNGFTDTVPASTASSIVADVDAFTLTNGDGLIYVLALHGATVTTISETLTLEGSDTTLGTPNFYVYSEEVSGTQSDVTFNFSDTKYARVWVIHRPGDYNSTTIVETPVFSTGAADNDVGSVTPAVQPGTAFTFFTDEFTCNTVTAPSGYTLFAGDPVCQNTVREHAAAFDDYTTTTATGALTWGGSIDGDTTLVHFASPDAPNTATVSFDADTYELGATLTATATNFGSVLTTLTEQAGSDVISAEAGATSSSATYSLCALADLTPAGSCNNTKLGVELTYEIAETSAPNDTAQDTLTYTVPSTYFFGTLDCNQASCPGDSLAPVGAVIGDGFLCRALSGIIDSISDSMSAYIDTAAANIECRMFDESAGAWLAAFETPVNNPNAGLECNVLCPPLEGILEPQLEDTLN